MSEAGETPEFAFEPGEAVAARHAPVWVDLACVAIILLAELAVAAMVSRGMAAAAPRDPSMLAALLVIALFAGAALQFLALVMPPLVQVTDRRILRRRRLGWDDPDAMRLAAIESVEQQGWRLVVRGDGRSLEFFCPGPFAARIRCAIDRANGTAT